MNYKKQGSKLRNVRLSMNYTQADLARHLNISRQAYSKYEQGHSCPSLDKLLTLSFILKYNLVDIYLSRKELFPCDLPIKRYVTNQLSAKHLTPSRTNIDEIYLLIKLFSFLSENEKPLIFNYISTLINEKGEKK